MVTHLMLVAWSPTWELEEVATCASLKAWSERLLPTSISSFCNTELSLQPVQLTAGQDAFRKYTLNCVRNATLHSIAIRQSRFDESRVESLRDASNAGLKRQSLTLSKVQAPEERCLLLAVPSQVQAPQAGKEYVSIKPSNRD